MVPALGFTTVGNVCLQITAPLPMAGFSLQGGPSAHKDSTGHGVCHLRVSYASCIRSAREGSSREGSKCVHNEKGGEEGTGKRVAESQMAAKMLGRVAGYNETRQAGGQWEQSTRNHTFRETGSCDGNPRSGL